jgi:hypothetical protein
MRWTRRPPGSNWGDFGADDQLGRLNLVTSAHRLAACKEVREGIAFALSLPLDVPGGIGLVDVRSPRRGHDVLGEPGIYNLRMAEAVTGAVDVCCDDAVLLHTQYSTQWDALCHVGAMFDADGDGQTEPVYYNGFRAGIDVGPEDGAKALGIENQAAFPLQTSGVLVDLHAVHGPAPARVGYDDLMRALDSQRAEVRPADVLCLHTGYARALLDMNKVIDRRYLASHFAALDGRDERCCNGSRTARSSRSPQTISRSSTTTFQRPCKVAGQCRVRSPLPCFRCTITACSSSE